MSFIEDFGQTFDILITGTKVKNATNYVNAIKAAINSPDTPETSHFWEIDTANSPNLEGLIVLKPRAGTDVKSNQQITIRAGGETDPNRIWIGYAPDGGVDVKNWANLTDKITSAAGANAAPTYSGEVSITGAATGTTDTTQLNYGLLSGRIVIIEYRDMNPVYGMELASSLTIFFEAAAESHYLWGCHIGRVIAPDNASDPANGIHGDAIFVGVPTPTTSGATWLTGLDSGSKVRVGTNIWSNLRVTGLAAAGTSLVARAVNKDRLVPITAFGATAGEIGRTKYLRQFRLNLPHTARLPSANPESLQSWIGWQFQSGATNIHNHIMLWKRGPAVSLEYS